MSSKLVHDYGKTQKFICTEKKKTFHIPKICLASYTNMKICIEVTTCAIHVMGSE